MRFLVESFIACALGTVVLAGAHPASANQIVVGKGFVLHFNFAPDPTGVQCTVDTSVTPPSDLGQFTLTYKKKSQTSQPWKLRFTTTLDDTKPGKLYSMEIVSTYENTADGRCFGGQSIHLIFDILPKLEGVPKELWWFNGEEPANYETKSKLTAHPANFGPFTWSDFFNGAQVEFKHGKQSGTTLTTSQNTVEMSAKESNSLTPAEIQLTVNGVTTPRYPVTVNRPASLRRFISRDADEATPLYGYISQINYKILDRFGKVLPHDVPVIEHFTGPVIKDTDFPNPQWPRGDQVGGTIPADGLQDTISGCPIGLDACERPIPLPPRQPHRGNRKVNHWDGEIAIGSSVVAPVGRPVKGVVVERLVWQKFQDHARHCEIASPPGDSPTPGCPGLR